MSPPDPTQTDRARSGRVGDAVGREAVDREAVDSVAGRAAVHAALGEEVRLAIVEDLAVSDRSPTELAERFSIPTNLLAHHLDVLEQVGLIERFTSAGDRRRRYVRLLRAPLHALGLGGGLGLTAPPPGGRVLFVCSHNSARSQLAAALWATRTGGVAASAGTHPAERVHPGAVAAAMRAGLDLRGAEPRLLEAGDDADLVVTVCDQAHEELDPAPGWWHWSLPDPVSDGRAAAFDAVITELDDRIRAVTN
ncbi:MAG TPA: helix-turn-helix domain-containing protein [Ilumatobacteraceae bacterium]|nr:helix-turn-helix domain-containing protein [Ilumatobacteraceae bacterium]